MGKRPLRIHAALYLFHCFLFYACNKKENKVNIVTLSDTPQVSFALRDVESALGSLYRVIDTKLTDKADIVLSIRDIDTLKHEGFKIDVTNNKVEVIGRDEAGLMYGTLELAEQLKLYGFDGVKPMVRNPYLEMRGPKFNIPLDVRTPSYTDVSDVAQHNIPHMWDFSFWKDYIDSMARYRYNYISLWSLHPFPSLVKVPGYEDIALDDVQRSTVEWEENYNLMAIGFDAPEILENVEVLKRITIDEKIEFWKKVMAYGKSRNIDFHIITWNIFDYGTQGKYGITDDRDNEITTDYFRKSTKQLFVTYPDLAGIGLTTGENMKGANHQEREDWAYKTYGLGILDAAKEMPERQFKFIHRQHQSGAKEIAEKFKAVVEADNVEFLFCFKYAKAHVYSATQQPYHEDANYLQQIEGMKTLWGLRNDDTFYFRWGAPDFTREFINNLPHDDVAKGIYFGSDQWIWGRDFLTKEPIKSNQIEVEKHWYQWLLWGRLSYDPTISNERFKDILAGRFSGIDADKLFSAWQNASMVYPLTTGFHWGSLDFQWYIEGCKSRPKQAENETGFHDVNRFISLGVHPKSGNQSIPDYVEMISGGNTTTLKTPLEVSEKLITVAESALKELEGIEKNNDKELQFTLNDIRTVSFLGKHYAYKIEGATYLALFRNSNKKEYQDLAVKALENALGFWKQYVHQAMLQNHNPLWTNRVGIVDWNQITKWVEQDIYIAKNE
ncbi:carbohydrate-binding family 6 protein [Hyunsoonleella sp. SJ7]|uniref:Carbohydrate-binding family 6 protein n=1 Tax=Hyunsoonleella aquatilis TaxID=2762758 RepID=A0A923HAE3_9FLAO|nr:glycoside hydrolase family 20 zincin-like fold domain-containing protein [Hyunsoonleella aquatilis]MBC3758704.1 carbohydrate-binding family 6 protein [Hyunsoonleella aquatilis]